MTGRQIWVEVALPQQFRKQKMTLKKRSRLLVTQLHGRFFGRRRILCFIWCKQHRLSRIWAWKVSNIRPEWSFRGRVLQPLSFSVIPYLGRILRLPEKFVCENRTAAYTEEGLCILLQRLVYPCRYPGMITQFGRSPQELSLIANKVMDEIYEKHGHLLTTLDPLHHPWLTRQRLREMADAVCAKGAALPNCWGFVDGTVSYVETFKIQYFSLVCILYYFVWIYRKICNKPFPLHSPFCNNSGMAKYFLKNWFYSWAFNSATTLNLIVYHLVSQILLNLKFWLSSISLYVRLAAEIWSQTSDLISSSLKHK